ncbi:MAG: hypothetical protein ABSG83_04495 [Roseiarcus sp.]|jgi:hypothetical protein
MKSTSYRPAALAAALALALAGAPAMAAPLASAGPLAVAAAEKSSPAVETVGWRHYHRGYWGGPGPWVAGAALGVIGLGFANAYYDGGYGYGYGDPGYYGYGYPGYYGYGGGYGYGRGFHGGHYGGGHFHHR